MTTIIKWIYIEIKLSAQFSDIFNSTDLESFLRSLMEVEQQKCAARRKQDETLPQLLEINLIYYFLFGSITCEH